MDRRLELIAGRLRASAFTVDAVLAGVVAVVTIVLPSGNPSFAGRSVILGLLLVVPLAWRRRAPVAAAAAVCAAGLLELLVASEFLPANVAALIMIYSLAAYAPRWAERATCALCWPLMRRYGYTA